MKKICAFVIIISMVSCGAAFASPLENASQFMEKAARTAAGWGDKMSNGVNNYIIMPVKNVFVRPPAGAGKSSGTSKSDTGKAASK